MRRNTLLCFQLDQHVFSVLDVDVGVWPLLCICLMLVLVLLCRPSVPSVPPLLSPVLS
jgi:hypothetical protein